MSLEFPKHQSTAYTYRYNCKTWWGVRSGTRNIIVPDENDVEKYAINDANRTTGSSTCNIALMQKFFVTVQLADIYKFPLTFDIDGE